jgi:hypothetical protein
MVTQRRRDWKVSAVAGASAIPSSRARLESLAYGRSRLDPCRITVV